MEKNRRLTDIRLQTNPLTDALPKEIYLPNAPLIRVLWQVRFPVAGAIKERQFAERFLSLIQKDYPELREETQQKIQFGPEGLKTSASSVWRYFDLERNWRVTLSPEFVALEALKYKSRADFMSRLEMLLRAIQLEIKPAIYDRVGIRYLDQVKDDGFEKLQQFLHLEFLGVAGTALSQNVRQMLGQIVADIPAVPGGTLTANYGVIAPNATHDPSILQPINSQSWVLDIDAAKENSSEAPAWKFDVSEIVRTTDALAARSYSFFRWAVKDEFLQHYGGAV